MKINEAFIMAGPLYETMSEASVVGTWYDYFVVAETVDGTLYTHNVNFKPFHEYDANRLVNRVAAKGEINLDHWTEGTVWDHYKIPLTYAEEKDEAVFNERI
jgi:hypothetical protein